MSLLSKSSGGLVLPEATDMCISSSSSSSSALLSPSQRERLLKRASLARQPLLDCADDDAAVYQPYEGGLLHRNRLSFSEVDFCFVCECALRMDDAYPSVECTGLKTDRTHYPSGETVSVFRQLIMCDKCYINVLDAHKRDPTYRVRVGARSLAYFR